MNLLLYLLFQGVLLHDTLGWQVRMPKEIHGLRGSCLVIPCSFSYTHYPPTNPNRVVWYQWASKWLSYPLVYDRWYPNDVIYKFKGKTYLYGSPAKRDCSLLIETLDQSHHREKLYAWIDPENVRKSTYSFFDVTSTIHVDIFPKQPTVNIYGGERTGDVMTVSCHTYHTCPYSKPNIIMKGLEGSDQIRHDHIEDGLWKITLTRTGVVKAERSDIECTVTHYGGITTRATKNKNSACIYTKISIEPDRADLTEGDFMDFTCTINHSCLKDPPNISWSYKNMQVSSGNKKFTEFKSATFSTITFMADKNDDGKKLICTARFSGTDIQATVDLHVKHDQSKAVDPGINDTVHVYEADVVSRLTALPRSCVVIPCSFKMHEELAAHLRVRWVSQKGGYMFHTGQGNVLDNFKGRTKLLGNPDDQECTVEIDDVQKHDKGPFCFRAEKENEKYLFNNSCVFIVMQAPDKPVMSPIPDNIEQGTRVTLECSVKHTCPSHPPIITWSIPTAQETIEQKSIGEGVWKTVSTVIFIPTGYEKDQITCSAAFWGDKTVVNSSTQLSVQRIQGVGVETLVPSILVPILVFLSLCVGVIMCKRRQRWFQGRLVWTNSGNGNDLRFNNETLDKRSVLIPW